MIKNNKFICENKYIKLDDISIKMYRRVINKSTSYI